MTNSWIKRLTASLSAVALVGGMTFLAGCDDCDTCDAGCDTCESAPVETSYAPSDTVVRRDMAVRSEAAPVNVYRDEIPASSIERQNFNDNISVRDRSIPEPDRAFRSDLNRNYGAAGAAASREGVRNNVNVNVTPSRNFDNRGLNTPPAPSAQRDIHNDVNVNAQPPAENTFSGDLEQSNAQQRTPASQSDLQSQPRSEQSNLPPAQAGQPSASASAQANQPAASASAQSSQPAASASAQANQPAVSGQAAPAASRETVPASSTNEPAVNEPAVKEPAVKEPAASQPSANEAQTSKGSSMIEKNELSSPPASTPANKDEENR